jgi:hypothetical protein
MNTLIEKLVEEFNNHPAWKTANDAMALQSIRAGTSGYPGPYLHIEDFFTRLHDATIESILKELRTHPVGEGQWCDTGEDMEWSCRSKCVELAEKRILANLEKLKAQK